MEYFNYYIKVLKNYAVFTGRATRSEYWYFILFNFIISLILMFINDWLHTIYFLAILVPSIAVGIRRIHDVGKSGWWILVPIYNLVMFCLSGTPGPNAYGEDPKVS